MQPVEENRREWASGENFSWFWTKQVRLGQYDIKLKDHLQENEILDLNRIISTRIEELWEGGEELDLLKVLHGVRWCVIYSSWTWTMKIHYRSHSVRSARRSVLLREATDRLRIV